MINYKKEMVEQSIPTNMICDVCKKEYDFEKDVIETQEFQHIRISGGYGSVFGDGSRLQADICQNCFKKLMGEYLSDVEESDQFVL
jgi:hypothetical protein